MKKLLVLLCLLPVFSFAQTAAELHDQAMEQYVNENYKEALQLIDASIAKDGSKLRSYMMRGNILWGLERYQEVYDLCNQAIALFPDSSLAYVYKAATIPSFQLFEEAIETATAGLKVCTDDEIRHVLYENRAAAKIGIRRFESAYRDLMKVYRYDSTNLANLINLGVVCDEVGRGDETLVYLLKAVAIDSTHPGPYANIGFKYQDMGEHDKAIYYYTKVLELDPEQALGYSNRAYSRMKKGDLDGAMEDINTSIEMYPLNSWAFRNRGLIYLEKGKDKKACADFEKAIELGFTRMYGNQVLELIGENCMK